MNKKFTLEQLDGGYIVTLESGGETRKAVVDLAEALHEAWELMSGKEADKVVLRGREQWSEQWNVASDDDEFCVDVDDSGWEGDHDKE